MASHIVCETYLNFKNVDANIFFSYKQLISRPFVGIVKEGVEYAINSFYLALLLSLSYYAIVLRSTEAVLGKGIKWQPILFSPEQMQYYYIITIPK